MISFSSLDKFEKQTSPADGAEPESKTGDFAALLSIPAPTALPTNDFVQTDASKDSAGKTVCTGAVETIQSLNEANCQTATPEILLPPAAGQQKFAAGEELSGLKSLFAPKEGDLQKENSIQTNGAGFPDSAESVIKAGIEAGKIEILKSPENVKTPGFPANDFLETALPPKKEKGGFSKNLPKLFGEISNVLDARDSVKSEAKNSSPAPASGVYDEPEVIEQIKSKPPGGNFTDLNQTETEGRKAEKPLKVSEQSSAIDFDKFFASAKEPLAAKTAQSPQSPVETSRVFKQVEPQVLQLAGLVKVENEKKVLRMRLHPAELGAVEIKLEKNASGSLDAHFQTETEGARQILSESLDQLRDSLQNSGWQIGRLDVSCAAFSAAGDQNRENASRQFETVENPLNTGAASDNSAGKKEDLRQDLSSRLLSLRA